MPLTVYAENGTPKRAKGNQGPPGYDTAPIGSVVATARRTWGDEYVLADGQSLTEALYPDCCAVAAAEVAAGNPLWTVSGTAPARTFTVPDLRDRFFYSQGTKAQGLKSQTNPALANPGEETHVQTANEMPTHAHGLTDPGHYHYLLGSRDTSNGFNATTLASGAALASTTNTVTTGITMGNAGGGAAHNNMPPYVVLAFLVKVKGVVVSSGAIVGPPGVNGAPGGQVFSAVIGDGAASSFTVSHGLGTREVTVTVRRSAAPYDEVVADVEHTDVSTVTVRTWPTIPAVGEYTVAVAAPGTQATLSITMDTWHLVGATGEPAFQNSWSNFDAARPVKFRKYPDGRVRLTGFIKGTTSGTVAFTLPVGYRPPTAQNLIFQQQPGTGSPGYAEFATSGAVTVYGNPLWCTFDGVEFDTESVLQTASVAAQPLDGWHTVGAAGEPAFQNSWAIVPGYPAGFRKDPFGKVLLRGMLKTGTVGAAAFTLPVGFRPVTEAHEFCTMANAGGVLCRCIVNVDGTVIPYISNLNHSIQGLTFDTESVGAYATGALGPPLVTALPTNPIDGQECYFVAGASGEVWRLRYNAASASAYKWEFVGGSMLDSGFFGAANTLGGGSSWSSQLSDGTNIVGINVPLAGDYFVQGNAQINVGDGTVRNGGVGVWKTTDPSTPSVSSQMASVTGGGYGQSGFQGMVKNVVAATRLNMAYLYLPVVGTYSYRQFFARPVRVG